jgi:hypothetical protein
MPPREPDFAICTFQRVFDTAPKQDVVSLAELVAGLTAFDLKSKLRTRIERELDKVEDAWDRWSRGASGSGRIWKELEAAHQAAERRGGDSHGAVRSVVEHLRKKARSFAKTDLRLWSPSLYTPDVKRGSEGVLHLSCVVLDFDGGASIAAVDRSWERHHHVIHSTWSHSEALPRFRLVLPLAGPVDVEHWPDLWRWVAARAGGPVDGSMKGVAATYAVPSTPGSRSERVAIVRPGPLLDPVAEGLAPWFAERAPPPPPQPAKGTHFRGGVRDHRYIRAWTPEAPDPSPTASDPDEAWQPDDDFDWNLGA